MKSSRKTFLSLFSILTLSSASAWAGNFVVNPGNDDCADGVGGLQQCLDVAVDNGEADTLQIQPGLYSGGFTYNAAITAEDFPLVLEGTGDTKPVIEGLAKSGISLIASGVGDDNTHFTLRNLQFEKGLNGNGGGLNVSVVDGDVTVEQCNFFGNKATLGAGLAISANGDGDGNATLSENKFQLNDAKSAGGGAFIVLKSGTITLEANHFENNLANIFDGGAANLSTQTGEIILVQNTAKSNHAKGKGGAFSFEVESAQVRAEGNILSHNSSGEGGGAVWGKASSEGAQFTYTNNVMYQNKAGNDEEGQGLDKDAHGGAIYTQLTQENSKFTFTHNTLVNNQSQDQGGAIALDLEFSSASALLYNNIVYKNGAPNDGSDIAIHEDALNANDAASVDLFNNLYSDFYSACQSEGEDCVTESKNILDQDPRFNNIDSGDFALLADSPAIDQGDLNAPELPALDLLGQARPALLDTNPDMGALEFQTAPVEAPAPQDQGKPQQDPAPDALDALDAQGGCSMSGGAQGSFFNLAWLAIAIVGMMFRQKTR